jgi:hypothetical protein
VKEKSFEPPTKSRKRRSCVVTSTCRPSHTREAPAAKARSPTSDGPAAGTVTASFMEDLIRRLERTSVAQCRSRAKYSGVAPCRQRQATVPQFVFNALGRSDLVQTGQGCCYVVGAVKLSADNSGWRRTANTGQLAGAA